MTAVVIPFDRRERMRQARLPKPPEPAPERPSNPAAKWVDDWFDFWGWKQ